MNDFKDCLTCIYCYSEPGEFEVWCTITGKIIDNGFGEGCSDSCESYLLKSRCCAITNNSYTVAQLPF